MAIGVLLIAGGGVWLYWQHNIEWAARVAWGEARGEPKGGMQAVLNVMVNRKRDSRFPSSLAAVARQHRQFTAFNKGDPNRPKLEAIAENDPEYQRAKRLATFAQLGLLWDITDDATFYHSDKIERPVYLSDAKVTKVIGHHVFYRSVD